MARHFESVNISSLRGTRSLEIQDLSDLNIVVGSNNSGKTSLLEALMILGNPGDFNNVIATSRIREGGKAPFRTSLNLYDSFIYMFNNAMDEKQIVLSGKMNSREIIFELRGEERKILVDVAELIQQSYSIKRTMRESIAEEEIEGFDGEHTYTSIDKEQLSIFDGLPVTNKISFHKYIKRITLERHKPLIKMSFISITDHLVQNILEILFVTNKCCMRRLKF